MYILVGILLGLIVVIRQLIHSHSLKSIARATKAKRIYRKLFHDLQGFYLSKQDRIKHDDFTLVYGETCFDTLRQLLAKVQPQTKEIFYDLGSGIGNNVIGARLLYDFSKCIGIEKLPSLFQHSLEKLEQLKRYYSQAEIIFRQADFLKIDISDADIVFINATGFFGEDYQRLVALLKTLKIGTRIIIISKELHTSDFKLLYQGIHKMSWGFSTIYIYVVVEQSPSV